MGNKPQKQDTRRHSTSDEQFSSSAAAAARTPQRIDSAAGNTRDVNWRQHQPGLSSHKSTEHRPHTYTSPPQTADNMTRCMNDLADVQAFLQNVNEKMMTSSTADCGLDELELLATLKIRQQDLGEIRARIQRRRQGGTGREESELLLEMLNTTERDCHTTLEKLNTIQERKQQQKQLESLAARQFAEGGRTVEGSAEGGLLRHDEPHTLTTEWIDTNRLHTDSDLEKVRNDVTISSDVTSGVVVSSLPATPQTLPTHPGDNTNDRNSNSSSNNNNKSNDAAATKVEASTIDDWVEELRGRMPTPTLPDQRTTWKIDRHIPDFNETVFALYEKVKDREINRRLCIVFEGESGTDGGGMTREFFHICFEAVISRCYKDCKMFEGVRGHLLPDVTCDHLVSGYKYIGKMIAHAARNGCRGFPGLSPAIQHYLVYSNGPAFLEEMAPPMSIDDVADTGLRDLLLKMYMAKDLTKADEDVLSRWMDRSNCRVVARKENNELLIQTLLVFYIYKSRISQLEAIVQGLETMGLRQFLRDNPTPDNMEFVFPSPASVEVTPELFIGVLMTRGDEYDEQAMDYLKQFIQDLHTGKIENKKVNDLIQFLSGSPYLPSPVLVSFNKNIVYPVAHCCFNELELPMLKHHNYDSFRDAMFFALQHGTGFSTS